MYGEDDPEPASPGRASLLLLSLTN